jgi:hypothetical protein
MSEWLLQRGKGKTIGPFATDEIVEGIRAGEIPPETRVADPGGKQWVALGEVAPFAEALRARGAAPIDAREHDATDAQTANPQTPERPSAASAVTATPSARRPLRVAFGAATARGQARLRVAAGALTVAGLGALGLGASPLARSIFHARPALRDLSSVGGAALLVGAGLVLAGERLDRRGAQVGSATARGATVIAALTVLAATALAMREVASSSARVRLAIALTGAVAALLALVAIALTGAVAALLALVAIALGWPAFRIPARGRAASLARGAAVALLSSLALGGAIARARRALDVIYVRDPLDAPAFRDAPSVTAWLDAEPAGATRVDVVGGLVDAAVPIPCGSRARLVDRPAGGIAEIELLDGPERGARLFVPARATTPEPPRCR